MNDSKLWYGQFIRHCIDAADELDKAGQAAVGAKDDELFKIIYEMRMKLFDTVEKLIKSPKE